MDEQEKPPSLDDIDSRLRALREREEGPSESGPGSRRAPAGMAMGFRVGVELVAGVMVGVGIGWGLDRWLGTAPWLMVVFLLLGGAAGVINVVRLMKGMDETVGFGAAQRRQSERSKDQ